MKVNAFPLVFVFAVTPSMPLHVCVCVFACFCFLDHCFGAVRFWICLFALLDLLFWPFALFTSSWPSAVSLYPCKPLLFCCRLINFAEPKLLCLQWLQRDPKVQIQACFTEMLPICFQSVYFLHQAKINLVFFHLWSVTYQFAQDWRQWSLL